MTSISMPPIISVFVILLGLVSIFARDFVWSWREMMNEFWGKHVERTDLWDFWQVVRGVGLICFGLYMLSIGVKR